MSRLYVYTVVSSKVFYLIENENIEWYIPGFINEYNSVWGIQETQCFWTKNPNLAMKFNSFKDAQQELQFALLMKKIDTNCKVTEHKFL